MAGPGFSRGRDRCVTGSQARGVTIGNRKSRVLPTRGAQLCKRGRAKLQVPAQSFSSGPSILELQLDERSRAPGTENH